MAKRKRQVKEEPSSDDDEYKGLTVSASNASGRPATRATRSRAKLTVKKEEDLSDDGEALPARTIKIEKAEMDNDNGGGALLARGTGQQVEIQIPAGVTAKRGLLGGDSVGAPAPDRQVDTGPTALQRAVKRQQEANATPAALYPSASAASSSRVKVEDTEANSRPATMPEGRRLPKREPEEEILFAPVASSSQVKLEDTRGNARSSSVSPSKPLAKRELKEQADGEEWNSPSKGKSTPRSSKKAKVDNEEKRLARWRPKATKAILDRIARVRTQRFYMIGRTRTPGQLRETFQVLGSTGNVYTVTIDNLPTCDCPDSMKGNDCKHRLFVLHKCLGLSADSPHLSQKALLTSELKEIFDNAPAPPSHVVNAQAQSAWERATGSPSKSPANEADAAPTGRRNPIVEEDSCAICYEDIFGESLDKFIFCETSCGGAIHKDCFQNYVASQQRTGNKVLCVYCRAEWPGLSSKPLANPNAAPSYSDGYLNLADAVGISRNRDTSSYYHGSRRGESWKEAASRYAETYGVSHEQMYDEIRYGGRDYRAQFE